MRSNPRCFGALVVLGLSVLMVVRASAAGPADRLLKLAPADASLTIAVENLKERARAWLDSPILTAIRNSPEVRDWLASDQTLAVRKALRKASEVLGVDATAIRDDLLGEAFVLTLRIPPGGTPDDARGLLLIRVPSQAMLDRVVTGLTAADSRESERATITPREHEGRTYHGRSFAGGKRAPDYFTVLGDRVFAWSNSEDLIHQLIERDVKGIEGLSSLAEFQGVRERLSEQSLVSLYVDPRFVTRLLENDRRTRPPNEERLLSLIGRYFRAVTYAGAALDWRSGPVLQIEEQVDPDKLDPELKRWGSSDGIPGPTLARVPASTLALAHLSMDAGVVFNAFLSLAPEYDPGRLELLRMGLRGILLGEEPDSILAKLGPGLILYTERRHPGDSVKRLPFVFGLELAENPDRARVAASLDNALRTVLVANALDPSHQKEPLRLDSTPVDGIPIVSLEPTSPFAYALCEDRLIVSNSRAAVGRAIQAAKDPAAGERFATLRSATFPGTSSYACADVRTIHGLLDRYRLAVARALSARRQRPVDDVARELDRVISFLGLFDCAFVTSRAEPNFAAVHHSIGIVKLEDSNP